jgi:hypothetical protein
MDDSTLKAVVSAEVRRAIGYMGGTISTERMRALDYYLGRPFGTEIEGRSSVVSTDVCDVVESILPSLLKIFTSGDTVVKFEPQGPEDERVAEQATDYCNWIFNRDNDGFTILYDWMKDALLQKLGVVKIWWDEREDETEETYEGLTDDELAQLLADDEIEPIEHTEYPATVLGYEPANDLASNQNDPGAAPPVAPDLQGSAGAPPAAGLPLPGAAPGMPMPGMEVMGGNGGPPPMLHDIKVKRVKTVGRVKIAAVPPEEFLVSPGTRDTQGAILMAHKKRTTRSRLVEEGYPRKIVDMIPAYDFNVDTGEEAARWADQEFANQDGDTLDPAADHVWVTECYINVDYDGDGKTELRKITIGGAGDAGEILENEPCEARPFFFLCPIRTPHVLIGRSVADLIMDIQLIQSTILRGALDNMYNVNSPRTAIVDGQVNLDDLLTVRAGGVVRMTQLDALKPLTVPSMMGPALQALEYMNSVRETRTGVTRYNQGLEADSLNKTASGISQVMNAAQQRIELIARIFAETGVKELFRGMLRLISKHQQKSRMIRLRQEWVPMDPREWNTSMDVTTNVGLGTGNKDQMLGHLMNILGLQEKIAQAGNPGGMIEPKNIYATLEKVVENSGLKSADPYFNDPRKVAEQQAQQPPGPPPPPSPQQMAEQASSQATQAQAAGDAQSAQMKAAVDKAKAEADLEKIDMDRQLNRAKFQAELAKLMQGMAAANANADVGVSA